MYDVELIDQKEEWIKLVNKIKSMSKPDGNSVEIGLFDDVGLIRIAIENEFGAPPSANRKWSIPERSFLRLVFDKDLEKLNEMMNEYASDIMIGKITRGEALKNMGKIVEKKVKDFIASDYWKSLKPNHPITIKIKKGDHPLIQVGKIYSVITSKVV